MKWCGVGIYAYVVCVFLSVVCVSACLCLCVMCVVRFVLVCVVRVFVCGECLCLFCMGCVWCDVCVRVPSVCVMWGMLRLARLHQLDQWKPAS